MHFWQYFIMKYNVARDQRDTTVGTLAQIKSCWAHEAFALGNSVSRRPSVWSQDGGERAPREEHRPAVPRRHVAAHRTKRLARRRRAPQRLAAAHAEALHGLRVDLSAVAPAGQVVSFRCSPA